MVKIEAVTLEEAYENAASKFNCSVTQLVVEVIQTPSKGFLGMFKKSAIIVAAIDSKATQSVDKTPEVKAQVKEAKAPEKESIKTPKEKDKATPSPKKKEKEAPAEEATPKPSHTMLNETIMPASFVSDQDDEDEIGSGLNYTADYDDEFDESGEEETPLEVSKDMSAIVEEVSNEINSMFNLTCFNIDKIDVSAYDNETLLIEFKGDDAALLIGKEGYRYKALSYMLFNWINSKYDIQLRLEIAEFLKNQEESVARYLTNVYENIDKDGRAQTKILDGVLVQIALKELREKYPQKYVVIRSTKDGLKYIIVNDYHNS
ncbi:protein jag [Sulfurimonas aquatica]|uniref:Protein jag n=1 Tax=Sulfurimonas aquatica TaxID=2672570 RepID=A0A975GD85_9BACT|nr:Jag N-terminal domain-containing protein [Sulfurimonas aquatica]QSZ42471.1 protein jag [Sulfurimonas aquatica]